MRTPLIYIFLFSFVINPDFYLFAQSEVLELEGAIKLDNTLNQNPEEGTIKWDGADFQGYNGSSWVSLTSSPYVQDVDGNIYNTVAIGEQVWLAENLRSTKYNDGTDIPLVDNNADWIIQTGPAYSWFNDDKDTLQNPFGVYYNFYVVETEKICPLGWRVPSTMDWNELRLFLGNDNKSGNKMKSLDAIYWDGSNVGASNSSGFNGYPSGYRNVGIGSFSSLGTSGQWHATEPQSRPWLRSWDGLLGVIGDDPRGGAPIRCLKN